MTLITLLWHIIGLTMIILLMAINIPLFILNIVTKFLALALKSSVISEKNALSLKLYPSYIMNKYLPKQFISQFAIHELPKNTTLLENEKKDVLKKLRGKKG